MQEREALLQSPENSSRHSLETKREERSRGVFCAWDKELNKLWMNSRFFLFIQHRDRRSGCAPFPAGADPSGKRSRAGFLSGSWSTRRGGWAAPPPSIRQTAWAAARASILAFPESFPSSSAPPFPVFLRLHPKGRSPEIKIVNPPFLCCWMGGE